MAKTVAPEKVSRLDREFLENGSKKLTKLFAAIFFLFLLGVGNAWGTDVTATLTLSSSVKFGTSSGSTLDDNKGNTWTCTGSNIQNSYQTTYSGQQFGTGSTNDTYTFTCTLGGGATITSISATMAAGNSTPTYDISVGGSSKKSGSLSSTSTTYSTGTISSTGAICITLDQNSGGKAVYLGAISVSYSRNAMVIYNGNGNDGGTKPTDVNGYDSGDKATVLGNTNGLYKVGFTFAGWNTEANGTGTPYAPGDEITMSTSDVTLYAQWTNTYAGSTFSLVEDVSNLSAGDKIVILDEDHATAISRTQNSNNRASVAAGASDNAGFTMSADNKMLTLKSATTVQVITLEDLPTPATNTYQFNVENGYLYAVSSSSAYLKTRTPNEDANGYWLISLSSGTFSVEATGTATYKYLKKNSSSTLFSSYSTGQKNVLVYVACTPLGAIDGDVSLSQTVYTITATWPTTEDEHETGYSVQLYDNNGSGAKGSAIGDPVAITGKETANRTYTFTGLTYNHQYFVGVTPTYSGDGEYCNKGMEVTGNTTTEAGYTVTYVHGIGATGEMTDPNSPYDAGAAVTVLDNEFTNCGAVFNVWSAKDASLNVIDVSGGSFTMPSSNVTITATWTNKQDEFLDYMHENDRMTRSGTYTTPAALSNTTPGEACEGTHYKFMGWVEADYINEDGTLKDGYTLIPGSESGHCADNKTFYAIWAEEE